MSNIDDCVAHPAGGPIADPSRDEEMWEYYTSHQVLYHSKWFYPFLMWALPPELRWPYVKRYEEAATKLLLSSIGGEILSYSEGFAPGHDVKIHIEGRDILLEHKTTDRHLITIEGGRKDRTASGLSATDSDAYCILSRDQVFDAQGHTRMKGKLRIAFTHMLCKDYERVAKEAGRGEISMGGFANNATYGVKLNPAKDMNHHIWAGDVKCKVDMFNKTKYNMDSFIDTTPMMLAARGLFKNGIELMEKKLAENAEETE